MFFVIRVNKAISDLGVSPLIVRPEHRQMLQHVGKRSGNSPQEVALQIFSQLPISYRASLQVGTVHAWAAKRAIDTEKPEVRDALGHLCIWDLL